MDELHMRITYTLFLPTGDQKVGVLKVPKYYGLDLIIDKLEEIKKNKNAYRIEIDDYDIEMMSEHELTLTN